MYSSINTLEERVFEGLSRTLEVCAEIFQENKDKKRETSEWVMARNYVLGLRMAVHNIRKGVDGRQPDRLIEGLCENYYDFLERDVRKKREEILRREGSPLNVFVYLGYLGSFVSAMGGAHYFFSEGKSKEALCAILIAGTTYIASSVIKKLIRIREGVPGLVKEIRTLAEYKEALKDKSIMKNTICRRYAELEGLIPEIV